MSTWHQEQAATKLYHDTCWTIVDNPPNRPRSCTTFTSESAARTTLDLWRKNGNANLTLLPPANNKSVTGSQK